MQSYLYQKIGTAGYGKTESIKIAQALLDSDYKELNYAKIPSRPDGYFVPEHQTKIKLRQNEASEDQIEKRTIRQAIIDNYKRYAIDYEINICPGEKQNIDVLFHFLGSLWIGEGKGPNASGDEPLLKAVLEIETYSRIINSERFVLDFSENLDWLKSNLNSSEIKKCVILFTTKDDRVSPMYRQLFQKEYEPIHQLMRKLKIYAVKAELFCDNPGKIEFFEGFSPEDY